MAKLPWFKFFPGDWMKDPDLRRCSLFARGLLADLLCLMFEANPRGCLMNSDGSPWTDEELARAAGGTLEETTQALAELEAKGVLSRNDRNCLYSRRLMRDEEIRKSRADAGSKGGSKTQAKAKQMAKQNSSKPLTSDISISENLVLGLERDGLRLPVVLNGEEFRMYYERWLQHQQSQGSTTTIANANAALARLAKMGCVKGIDAIEYSIAQGYKGIFEEGGVPNDSPARIRAPKGKYYNVGETFGDE